MTAYLSITCQSPKSSVWKNSLVEIGRLRKKGWKVNFCVEILCAGRFLIPSAVVPVYQIGLCCLWPVLTNLNDIKRLDFCDVFIFCLAQSSVLEQLAAALVGLYPILPDVC